MYGMENANQPSNDQVPNNYFLCGEKFLPKKYENDFQLKNLFFCPDTKKYVMNEKYRKSLTVIRFFLPLKNKSSRSYLAY
jgi:hypothetical protein